MTIKFKDISPSTYPLNSTIVFMPAERRTVLAAVAHRMGQLTEGSADDTSLLHQLKQIVERARSGGLGHAQTYAINDTTTAWVIIDALFAYGSDRKAGDRNSISPAVTMIATNFRLEPNLTVAQVYKLCESIQSELWSSYPAPAAQEKLLKDMTASDRRNKG